MALKFAGKPDEAEAEYQSVLADRIAASGPRDADVLITRHNLNLVGLLRAREMRKGGAETRATAAFERALAERVTITADTRAALGPDHPQTLATWSEEVA